jgi:signal transduction histidine kinase
MHQGNIEVKSRVGRGTTFRISLPDHPPVTAEAHWL